MATRKIAVLPLSSTGVMLTSLQTTDGQWTLGIPRGTVCDDLPDVQALLRQQLGIEAEAESLDDASDAREVSMYRVRMPARARPRSAPNADLMAMDFASFEKAIASGRISDLITIATWLRHRLLEGETTRRRRLSRPVSWTQDRVETLERLWREGRTGGEIAKAMGITRNAVLGRLHLMGLSDQVRSTPEQPTRDMRMRQEILEEFEAAFGRPPVDGRSGDAAMLVALAAMRADRCPNVITRWSGIELHEVMEILRSYHDKGIWRSDDPPPERWSGGGRLLSMMIDAQVAYGIFRNQEAG